MTRQQTSRLPRSEAHSLLRPLQPARNLTDEVVERVAGEIRAGRLAPGQQLPTEAKLMNAMNVSRTVVREAVAALKAEGLVVTRQGLGAFVATDPRRASFRIPTESGDGPQAIADVLRVMELRLAVEVEAAALAAEHASTPQIAGIKTALKSIDAAIAAGNSAVQEDFDFHRAIAQATLNPHFPGFLAFLGRHVIPRQAIRAAQGTRDEQLAYLAVIQKDHVRIFDAVRARDAAGARAAMRAHLSKSIARYRRMSEAQDTN